MYCRRFTHIIVIFFHVLFKNSGRPTVSQLVAYGISQSALHRRQKTLVTEQFLCIKKNWPTIRVSIQIWTVTPFQLSPAFPPCMFVQVHAWCMCYSHCVTEHWPTSTVWQAGTASSVLSRETVRPSNKQPSVDGKKPYFVLMVLCCCTVLSSIHWFFKLQCRHVL